MLCTGGIALILELGGKSLRISADMEENYLATGGHGEMNEIRLTNEEALAFNIYPEGEQAQHAPQILVGAEETHYFTASQAGARKDVKVIDEGGNVYITPTETEMILSGQKRKVNRVGEVWFSLPLKEGDIITEIGIAGPISTTDIHYKKASLFEKHPGWSQGTEIASVQQDTQDPDTVWENIADYTVPKDRMVLVRVDLYSSRDHANNKLSEIWWRVMPAEKGNEELRYIGAIHAESYRQESFQGGTYGCVSPGTNNHKAELWFTLPVKKGETIGEISISGPIPTTDTHYKKATLYSGGTEIASVQQNQGDYYRVWNTIVDYRVPADGDIKVKVELFSTRWNHQNAFTGLWFKFSSSKGVYNLYTSNTLASVQALSKSHVDGSVVRAHWSFIEPSNDAYNWSMLDADIARAEQYGKDVVLEVIAGYYAPDWVKNSVPAEQTVCFTHERLGYICAPFPWNTTYLGYWYEFVDALGARYRDNTTVKVVRATGPSAFSEINVHGDIADYGGLTREQIKEQLKTAWKGTIDRYETAFEGKKVIVVAVQTVFGDPSVAKGVVDYGYNTYGRKFGLMGLWLSAKQYDATNPMLDLKNLINSYSSKTFTGYQMLWFVTGDPTNRMEGSLRTAIDNGLSDGVSILEIYEIDILDPTLENDIIYAHNALTG